MRCSVHIIEGNTCWGQKGLSTLVTQPMLQRRPNRMELRLMDSYIQILCRFQKCKQKVPPPSGPFAQKKKHLIF